MNVEQESTLAQKQGPPTLDEVRTWPAAIDVSEAARALGMSNAHLYQCIRRGECPIKTIKIGSRVKVSTLDLLRVLEGK